MTSDPVEAYVIEAAAGADLILDADSLAAVIANTRILRALAAQFADIPLPADLDPAAVLRL
jgi:hypothetical protein